MLQLIELRNLSYKVFGCSIFDYILALGQILSLDTFQLTLLAGHVTQTESALYKMATIYLVTSVIWWLMFCKIKSIYVLSLPFFIYGASYLIVGISQLEIFALSQWGWNFAMTLYACASSSTSIYFGMSFIEEGVLTK